MTATARTLLLAVAVTAVLAGPARGDGPMNSTGFGQLPGHSGCTAEHGGGSSDCADGYALRGANDVAVSPDGANVYVASRVPMFGVSIFGGLASFSRSGDDGTVKEDACLSSDRTTGVDGTAGVCAATPALDGATGVAISPDGKNVYAVSFDGNSLSTFARDPDTGALTDLGCLQTPSRGRCGWGRALLGADSVLVTADGRNVYVASRFGNAVDVFARDADTGALSELGCVSNDSTDGVCEYGMAMQAPTALTASPDGKFVYVGAASSSAIDVLARDAGTGALTQVGCVMQAPPAKSPCQRAALLGAVNSVVASPDGGSVYAVGGAPTRIVALDRDAETGALAQRSCVDFLEPPPDPSDDNSDDSDDTDDSDSAASASAGAAADDPCTSVPGVDGVTGLAMSPDGHKLYSVGYSNLSLFARRADGSLRQTDCLSASDARCGTARALSGSGAIALSPDGDNAYVVVSGSAVAVFGPAPAMPSAKASVHGTTASVRMACPVRARQGCAGWLALKRPVATRRARAKGRSAQAATLAQARFRMAAGRTGTVTVRLPRSVARSPALRRAGVRLRAITRSTIRANGEASRIVRVRRR